MNVLIAIDGYEANIPNRVGIGSYAFEILNSMYELLKEKKDITTKVVVYLPNQPLSDMPKQTEFWTYKVLPIKFLWTFISLPLALFTSTQKPQVIFSPTHYVPRFVSTPKVMAIMDLSYLFFPQLFKKKDLYQLTEWTKYAVGCTKAIMTISTFSKNAIIRAYNVDKERVFVTYPGFRMNQITSSMNKNITNRFNISKEYILSVGTIQPRKNYSKLVEAFSLLKKKKAYAHTDLVIVGKKGWLFEEIFAAPQKYGVEKSVHFLDFVSDKELSDLYKNARCFILPSLYEGFGLPVLEAMTHGCIVVVSNVSSLPEIAGDAGIYVNPNDVLSIENGMLQALEEWGKEKGKKRVELGKKRLSKFSWKKAAEKTLDILEKVGMGENATI